MAERKAVNKYYPPEWTPEQGSINKFRGQHPLRERARKLDQGILIIRFEMPFNIWCGGCGHMIGAGTRFNAEKKQVGNYYSTKILEFRMKCHLCDNWFKITTDPQISDYIVGEGARRKEERFEYAPEDNAISVNDEELRKKMQTDPLYRLESQEQDKKRARDELLPVVAQLKEISEERKDDYEVSKLLRKRLREQKKEAELKRQESYRASLDMQLVDERPEDIRRAKRIRFNSATPKKNKILQLVAATKSPLPTTTTAATATAAQLSPVVSSSSALAHFSQRNRKTLVGTKLESNVLASNGLVLVPANGVSNSSGSSSTNHKPKVKKQSANSETSETRNEPPQTESTNALNTLISQYDSD